MVGNKHILIILFKNILKLIYLIIDFVAQWVFEMSNYYPFLYSKEYRNNYDLISACIDSSLMNNYFLHFAGSWYEGDM